MTETTPATTEPELTDLRWVGPATATELSAADITATDIASKRVSYRLLVDAGVNPGVAAKIRREHSLSWSFEAGDGLENRSQQIRGLGRAEADWIAASSGDWADEPIGGETESAADTETGSGTGGTADSDTDMAGTDTGSPLGTADESEPADRDAAAGHAATDWTPGNWPDIADQVDDAATAALGDTTEADGSGDPTLAEAAWRKRSRPTPVTDLEAVDETDADALAQAGITSVRSLATADPEHVADVLDIDADRVSGWHKAARSASD